MIKPAGKNRNMTGVAWLTMFFLIFINSGTLAYIMPAEQLLEFVLSNFSGINTLVIIQSTLQETSVEGESVQQRFKEQLWLKSPGRFQSRVLEQEVAGSGAGDLSYRRLIMAGRQSGIEDYLRGKGIDLEQVSLTRLDGKIAFRIGDPGPYSPTLLIEKERFLPLLIRYPSPENSAKMAEVRFRDYRRLEKGWYPFEILYSSEGESKETYTIQSCEVNVPVNPSIFSE